MQRIQNLKWRLFSLIAVGVSYVMLLVPSSADALEGSPMTSVGWVIFALGFGIPIGLGLAFFLWWRRRQGWGVLGDQWEPGQGTIITSAPSEWCEGGTQVSARRYEMNVQPDAGGPVLKLDVIVDYKWPEGSAYEHQPRFSDGQVVPVKVDVKRRKAKVDFDAFAAHPTQPPVQEGTTFVVNDPTKNPVIYGSDVPVPEQLTQLAAALHQSAGQAPQAPSPELADQLTKLAGLRDSGVLTPAEFETAKQKLLAS